MCVSWPGPSHILSPLSRFVVSRSWCKCSTARPTRPMSTVHCKQRQTRVGSQVVTDVASAHSLVVCVAPLQARYLVPCRVPLTGQLLRRCCVARPTFETCRYPNPSISRNTGGWPHACASMTLPMAGVQTIAETAAAALVAGGTMSDGWRGTAARLEAALAAKADQATVDAHLKLKAGVLCVPHLQQVTQPPSTPSHSQHATNVLRWSQTHRTWRSCRQW